MALLYVPGQYKIEDDITISKVGGVAMWINNNYSINESASCNKCQNKLQYILQLYAPINDCIRILYFYICTQCNDQIKVYRIHSDVKIPSENMEEKVVIAKKSNVIQNDSWGFDDSSDDDSDDDDDNDDNELVDKLKNMLAVRDEQKDNKIMVNTEKVNDKNDDQPKKVVDGFVAFTLEIEDEPEHVTEVSYDYEMKLYEAYKAKELESTKKGNKSHEKWQEEYEESGDKDFDNFHQRINLQPQQCIRYEYDVDPLLPKKLQITPQNCHHCDAIMKLECQLMPNLLNELKDAKTKKLTSLEYLTACVYVCSESCQQNTIVEERIIIINE